MRAAPLPELLTSLDVSAWLGISASKVERLARKGGIPCVVLPDDSLVFRPDELTEWLDSLDERRREVVGA